MSEKNQPNRTVLPGKVGAEVMEAGTCTGEGVVMRLTACHCSTQVADSYPCVLIPGVCQVGGYAVFAYTRFGLHVFVLK